jgi:nitroreductase
VYDVKNEKKSAESKVKKLLDIPNEYRVISIMPIGKVKNEIPKKDRKLLRQIVYQEKFGKR